MTATPQMIHEHAVRKPFAVRQSDEGNEGERSERHRQCNEVGAESDCAGHRRIIYSYNGNTSNEHEHAVCRVTREIKVKGSERHC